jgi:hypothetical protein
MIAKICLALALVFASTASADDVCGFPTSGLYNSLTQIRDDCTNEPDQKYPGWSWLCSFGRNGLTRTVLDWDAMNAQFTGNFAGELLATCQERNGNCDLMDEGGLDACIMSFMQCLKDEAVMDFDALWAQA